MTTSLLRKRICGLSSRLSSQLRAWTSIYHINPEGGRSINKKTWIVYDASAQADLHVQSLNECLYPGPPLQNKLWDVLVQQRAYPIAVTGDINKASLQIPIKEAERDAL